MSNPWNTLVHDSNSVDWTPNQWTSMKDHEPTAKIPIVHVPSAVITGELPRIWAPEEEFYQDLQRAKLEAEAPDSRFRLTVEFIGISLAGALAAAIVLVLIGLAILAAQPQEDGPDTSTIGVQQLGQFNGAESTTVVEAPIDTTPVTSDSRTTPETKKTTLIYADCATAELAGVTPLRAGDAGYSSTLDGDGDGVACEVNTATIPTVTVVAEETTTTATRQQPTTTVAEQPAPAPVTEAPATTEAPIRPCDRIGEPAGDGQSEWVQNPNPPGGCVAQATTTTATTAETGVTNG